MTARTLHSAPSAPSAAPPASPDARPSARPRQIRWLLRLHRPALYAWAALVLVLAAGLLWLGGPLTDAAAEGWRQFNACGMAETCAYDQPAILRYRDFYLYATIAVLAVPFLVAAWAGTMLTGRELETGTAGLAWTQSVTPARWLAARLLVPAALVTAGTGLLAGLHHYVWSAGRGRIDTAKSWYDSSTFFANGPVPVALALTGLAVGALAGLLWRRSLPALITSVAATGGVFVALHWALPYLWPTVHRVSSLKLDTPAGVGLSAHSGVVTSSGEQLPQPWCGSSVSPQCRALYEKLDAVGYFRDYHPFSHHWPLQLTATAVVLALGALLTLAAFRVLRARTGAVRGMKTAA
ncbi:ABC transporter permease [Streptomyces albus]|uniref:ABC transporter permease n=1 Tax=Streptomyces albus TaxID=1888 RepID=UPI0033CE09FE